MKRIVTLVLAALAVFCVTPKAGAQDPGQDEGPKQRLTLVYPREGIVLSGSGDDAVKYTGLTYVKVFPISPRLKKKYGDDPIFSDELHCKHGENSGGDDYRSPSLPLGIYEIQFSMREGNNMKTCIKRPVILSSENSPTVTAEFSNAKTLVIGGDHTLQQMEAAITELVHRVLALQAEVAALKGGTKAAPAPAPDVPSAGTDAPAK